MTEALDEFLDAPTLGEQLEEARRALRNASRALARHKTKTDDLVAATLDASTDAIVGRTRLIELPTFERDRRRKGEEVALWHLTDWQGAKKTVSYDTDVMRERVRRFVRRATSITEIQRADHPVKTLTIALGGDMIEGLFNFPTQPFEIDRTIFDQFHDVALLLVETVTAALTVYERVHVVPEWGNHGRIGSKRSAVPRSDNFDRMTYELARRVLAATPATRERVSWQDCPEDIQRLEIGDYRALVIHGDEAGRNGYVSQSTMSTHVAKWQSGAYRWAFRDVYVGHYHTHNEIALPNGYGSIYYTGSTESDNRYARDGLASAATPSQRLHFVNPRKGRVTAQYKIWLEDVEAAS